MRRKSEVEMKRAGVAKTARTLVRLKHSLAADQELNDLLPETLEEFDKAVGRGELTGNVRDTIANVLEGR